MKSGIYIITNIVNNKVYVGSSKDYKQRIRSHKYNLKKNTHVNKHLQSSFNKYGENNFIFKLLELTDNLIEREIFHINRLEALNRNYGYNKAKNIQNTSGYKWSEESKLKLSLSKKGIKMHINTKQALILANKNRIYKIEYLHSKENIEKSAKARMIPILEYGIDGNFIKEWESATTAAKYYNIKNNIISDCCRGNKLIHNKSQWYIKPIHGFYPIKVLEYKRRTGNRNLENFKRLCIEMYNEKSSELLGSLEEDNQQPS